MKIDRLEPVSKERKGRTCYNGIRHESHEKSTFRHLNKYGYNIETVIPSQTPNSRNPDALINGVLWEAKAPITDNKKTLKKRFHRASQQSTQGHIIIDLRLAKRPDNTERIITKLFEGNKKLRKMILIKKDGSVWVVRK